MAEAGARLEDSFEVDFTVQITKCSTMLSTVVLTLWSMVHTPTMHYTAFLCSNAQSMMCSMLESRTVSTSHISCTQTSSFNVCSLWCEVLVCSLQCIV